MPEVEDATVDLTFADRLPASALAPPPARPVWTTVKTDSERHIERLEARLAQLQAAQRRPFADALGMPRRVAGSGAARARSARTVPPTAQARQPAGSEHMRELTEVELLALEGGGGRVPSDADNVAMLVRAARGAGDVDADDDDEPAVVVERYAEILAARRTGEGAANGNSSGSGSGSDSDDDDDEGGHASATAVTVPTDASAGWVAVFPDTGRTGDGE